MPAPFSCGNLARMKKTAIALALLAVAAPAAQATEWPGNESPRCTYQVPKKMRLKPALSRGIPVEVTCDGSAEASSIALIESKKQQNRWVDLHNHGVPGIAKSDILTFTEAGTQSLRVEIVPKKFFRHYAKTKLRILLGVQRDPDKPYHTSVDSGKVITLIR
jgi:hypothetical protein